MLQPEICYYVPWRNFLLFLSVPPLSTNIANIIEKLQKRIQWDFFSFPHSMIWLARRSQGIGIWLSLFKGEKWYNLSSYRFSAFCVVPRLVNAGKTAVWQLIDISALNCLDIFAFCDIEEKTRKGMEATEKCQKIKKSMGRRNAMYLPGCSCSFCSARSPGEARCPGQAPESRCFRLPPREMWSGARRGFTKQAR